MTCFYTALEHEALLHITGPEALTFLQGQVTCDTRKLSPDRALPGVYCTVQGRVVCDFMLAGLGTDHFAMRMRRAIRADSAALLNKYIIFSRAELEAQRDDWQVLACWGSGASSVMSEIFGAVPDARYGARCGDGFTVLQMDDAGEQFECYLDSASRPELLAGLQSSTEAGTEASWCALQIGSGIARIESATAGEFIPQMLNYDITGHISFNKGCYTGQEVVARMHYRGKPKRRLYAASISATDLAPVAGTPLYRAGAEQAVGNIVNSVLCAENQIVALITATRESVTDALHLESQDGPLLKVGSLPYSIPEK